MEGNKWIWNFDVYDESDSPTKEGYYRTIDDEGNEITDYYFNEPRMTPHGIGYWKYGTRPIIAWKYLGDTADTSQTDDAYFLKLMSAVERGEISDAGANQAWYEYINHKDEPQTEEPTWEQVKEYCNKRCLDIVDSALRKQWYKDEPQTDCPWK